MPEENCYSCGHEVGYADEWTEPSGEPMRKEYPAIRCSFCDTVFCEDCAEEHIRCCDNCVKPICDICVKNGRASEDKDGNFFCENCKENKMKVIKKVEDLEVGKWYSFTPKRGLASYLVGNHKISRIFSATFDVSTNVQVGWGFNDSVTIIGPLDVEEEKEKPYQFELGDIAMSYGSLRFIGKTPDGKVFSIATNGYIQSTSQEQFRDNGYRLIGKLSDPKVIEFFESLRGE